MGTATKFFFEHINDLYLNEKQSDVTIIVDDVQIPAHRDILAQRCQYFRTMFNSGLLESASNIIRIQEAPIDGFMCILKWIYTGTTDVTSIDNAFEVLRLAEMYDIPEIVDGTVEYFTANLTVNIICLVLNEAVLLSLDKLTDAVIDFVEDNPNEVLKHETFKILSTDALKVMLNRGIFAADKNDVFNTVKAWMNANRIRFIDFCDVLKNMPLGTLILENVVTAPSDVIDEMPSIRSNLTDQQRQTDHNELDTSYSTNAIKNKAAWDHLLKHGPIHKIENKNIVTHKYSCTKFFATSGCQLVCDNNSVNRTYVHQIGDAYGMVFDLGRRFMVNYLEMLIVHELTNYSYWISVSDDNIMWDRVIDRSKYPCTRLQKLYFEARPVRFIRICATVSTDGEMKIAHFKALYTTEPFEVDLKTTLRIPSHNVFTESKCIQGKLIEGTGALDVGSDPTEGNIYQLFQPYLLDSMKLYNSTGDACIFNYEVEVSVDQATWTRVFGEENVSGLRKISFDRQVVVFIRISGTYEVWDGSSALIIET